MKATTLAALQQSIARWETLQEMPVERIRLGGSACPLCHLFNPHFNGNPENLGACIGCPIAAAGGNFCSNTPYPNVEDELDKLQLPENKYATENMLRAALAAELNFLKTLLPAKGGTEL